MANPDVGKSEKTNTQINNSNTECTPKQQIVEKANERPKWLPDGWTVDIRTRKSGLHTGSGYKCYIDPLNGYKFYSKPEVLRYLETTKDNSCAGRKEKKCPNTQSLETKDNSCTPNEKKCPNTQSLETRKDNSCTPKKEKKCPNSQSLETVKDSSCTPEQEKKLPSTQSLETVKDNSCSPEKEKKRPDTQSPSNVVIEKSIAEDLPPGWIKEVKIRQNSNGIRKDPFYKDPLNGYVFRSKKDVQRYLASGDIGTCVFKPSRRQIQDEDNLTPSSAAKRQKLKQSAPEQQPFAAGEELFDKSCLELPDANSSRKGQHLSVQSGMMVAPVPTESVVNMHSLEDGAENLSEMKKISDPGRKNGDIQEKEHVENMMKNADEKNHSNPRISKKKEFNVRCRSSPRLAGIEPVQLANTMINEQTLQVPKRNLRKSRTTVDVDLENRSSHHFHGVPKIEHAHKNHQEEIKTNNNLSEDQAIAEQKPNKLETDRIGDKEPDIHTVSNKFSDWEHHIPSQASKQIAGFDHELMNNSVSLEKTPKYESKRSRDGVNEELRQSEGGPATALVDHVPINGESANKRQKSSKTPPVTDNQQEKVKGEEKDDGKSEPQMSFAFHYYWSDPSLENAINTLTSVLPVENSVDTAPTTAPQTDIKNKLVDSVTGRSRDRNPQLHSNKSKKKKELKVPMRVSKRLAGLEPERKPSDRALEYATKKTCKEEPIATATEISSNGASDHPDIVDDTKLVCQASHGLKTEVLGESSNKSDKSCDAQTIPEEQLQKTEVLGEWSNKSDKSYDAQTIPKEQLQKTEVLGESSYKSGKLYDAQTISKEQLQKTEVLGESSNKSDKSYDAQTVLKEQLQKVEAENIGDERSEPQLPMTFGDSWSDPCLDFAFKTLTGALPFDATTNMLPSITPDLNDPPNKELQGSVVPSISEDAQDNSNQSQNKKEYSMVTQHSEPLLRQPELRTSSPSCENATKITFRQSYGDESCVTRNLDGEPIHVDAGNETQLIHHSRNVNTSIHEQPLLENRQVRQGESIITEQPPLETETMNHDHSESQFCASFMNSWSDPCLEFAFKTLTGVIPVEESFAIPGCFQQPANCHDRRDGGLTLPDFGSSSFSQRDNPFYYDIDVNSMPGQQSSRSFPFQPLEKPSLQSCPDFAPQNQYSQRNKNSQRQQNHCHDAPHL